MLKCAIIDPVCDCDEVRRAIIELFGRTDGDEQEEAEIGEEED